MQGPLLGKFGPLRGGHLGGPEEVALEETSGRWQGEKWAGEAVPILVYSISWVMAAAGAHRKTTSTAFLPLFTDLIPPDQKPLS